MSVNLAIPADWRVVLADELAQPYIAQLAEFVAAERATQTVYPPAGEEFTALKLTPFESVRVVILGQDPYHGPGQAQGLAFSVRRGVAIPPSLRNMYRELQSDLGITPPKHGDLSTWAERGVLLLNTVLTVRAGEANSHKGRGWERLTDAIIRVLNGRSSPLVFVLWGAPAQKKTVLIDNPNHAIVAAPHPSPLSANRGFFDSRPYSQVNNALIARDCEPIDWELPA
ncbi:MAG: uracil-DNA glycosylase [Oscillochloris sp.]|nr:uracil-DNA glycosylase [Oscillochloris sp.]